MSSGLTQSPARSDPLKVAPAWVRRGSGASSLLWSSQCFSSEPSLELFDPAAWRNRDALLQAGTGRGVTHFLDTGARGRWVLRHYRRGGLIARFNEDRYLRRAFVHTRPAQEFLFMASLWQWGLPVPHPVAARACYQGIGYQADLITRAVPASRPLAEHLMFGPLSHGGWERVGDVIAQLHQLAVWHADLNARNILLDANDKPWLIDFDRARYRPRGKRRWRGGNLARLRRSLDKFVDREPVFHFRDEDWRALLAGYEAAFDALRG